MAHDEVGVTELLLQIRKVIDLLQGLCWAHVGEYSFECHRFCAQEAQV